MEDQLIHPLQAAWLRLEDQSTPMHVGALLYFRPPGNAGAGFVRRLANHWRAQTQVASPWKLKLARKGRLQGLNQRLVEDDDLDLDYHFRHSALPAPGGERQIGELVSRLHSHHMDLTKPLWEVHLIEGLHDDRFAVYVKLHSVLFDGVETLKALRSMLTVEGVGQAAALWTIALPAPAPLPGVLEEWPSLLRAVGERVRNGLKSPLHWAGLSGVPRSALNDRFTVQRRFATQQYSCQRLQPVAKALAVSEDELLYYLCSSAIRRFFKEFNALPDKPMVALVADRSRRDSMLAPLLVSLGTHQPDRYKRLQDIKRSLKIARQQFALLSPADARAEGMLDVMPYLLRQALGVDHQLRPMFNLGITQLSLGDEARYAGEARLEAIYPMPMLLQGGALNIAFMRYAESWHIGFCGARDNLPHLQRMAVYTGRALDEIEEILADE